MQMQAEEDGAEATDSISSTSKDSKDKLEKKQGHLLQLSEYKHCIMQENLSDSAHRPPCTPTTISMVGLEVTHNHFALLCFGSNNLAKVICIEKAKDVDFGTV
uniref:Uncharacterized protein n=1 Tax=Oryza sativa subsp. japonica TaxID=39947 RepID=Q5Z7T0_ORYSJ|nr:hypothetical protein [Oryza sativa Japonica Group]